MSYDNWNKSTLNEHVEVIDCLHSKKPTPVQHSEYIFLEVSNISKDGRLLLDDVKYISKIDYDKWISRAKPKIGDIIITKTGRVGEIAYVDTEKNIAIGRNQVLLIPKDSIHPMFLKYYFFGQEYKNSLKSFTMTGTILESLHVKYIPKLSITLPNLQQQKAIANILSSLDDKIELNNKINMNLEEMAQALYKQWFVDFEFPNEDGEPYKSNGGEMIESELGLIPKGWEVGTIDDYLETSLGGTPSRKKKEYWNGNINWINSGKINDFRIISESEKITDLGLSKSSTKLLPRKTTVLAITGATLGQTSLLEIDSCSNQSVIGVLENDEVPYTYIFPMIQNEIDNLTSRQTGGAQQHINKNDVNSYKMIKPQKSDLIKFHQLTSIIYDKIAVNLFENKSIEETRDTLLPKLMSGKIEVPIEG